MTTYLFRGMRWEPRPRNVELEIPAAIRVANDYIERSNFHRSHGLPGNAASSDVEVRFGEFHVTGKFLVLLSSPAYSKDNDCRNQTPI